MMLAFYVLEISIKEYIGEQGIRTADAGAHYQLSSKPFVRLVDSILGTSIAVNISVCFKRKLSGNLCPDQDSTANMLASLISLSR